jgi:hypothetical protein
MSPQPDCSLEVAASTSPSASAPVTSGENLLAFLMNRRKTVSVTPAIGASTVAGAIRTPPIVSTAGTRTPSGISFATGLSQCFCINS